MTGAAPDTLCMKPTPEPAWRCSDVGGVSTGDLTPSAIAKAYPRNLLLTSACLWRHGTLVRAQPPHRVVVVGGAKGKLGTHRGAVRVYAPAPRHGCGRALTWLDMSTQAPATAHRIAESCLVS